SHLDVYNQIRGLCPWPVAYTTNKKDQIKIWAAELDDTTYKGNPGEIVKVIENESFVVACGNQKGIRVTDIQPAGRTRMTVAEFLRGSPDRIKAGSILGD